MSIQTFLLIHSDLHGTPGAGTDNHVVRVSDEPNMLAINQVHDGGRFPDMDCVVADTISFLHDWLGVYANGLTIEGDEGTSFRGTTFVGLVRTLALFGVGSRIMDGDPPPNLYVMQPASGTVFPPASAGPFRAASQHLYVEVTSPQPPPVAQPTPTALKEDGMGASFVLPNNTQQARFWVGTDGHVYESWYTGKWNGPVQVAGVSHVAGGLSASVTPDGSQQLLYWTGTDGHQYESWYANGKWNGPIQIPGS